MPPAVTVVLEKRLSIAVHFADPYGLQLQKYWLVVVDSKQSGPGGGDGGDGGGDGGGGGATQVFLIVLHDLAGPVTASSHVNFA